MEVGVKHITRPQKLPLDDLYNSGLPQRFRELNEGIVTYKYYTIVDKLRATDEKLQGYLVGKDSMEALMAKVGAPTIELLEHADDKCLRDPEREFDYVLGASERPNDLEITRKGTRTDPATASLIHVVIKVVNTEANKRVEGRTDFDYAIDKRTVGYMCSKALYDILDALP